MLPRSLLERRHLVGVAAVFLAGRIALALGGVRFDAYPPNQQMQLLDRELLAAHPLSAFTQNHVQPPLWSFFVGSVTRWTPFPLGVSFQVLFIVAGLATVVMLWLVLRELGASPWAASTAATVVGASPLLIRNESVLWYETLETTIITGSALAFCRYRDDPRPWRMAVLAGTLGAGVLTRMTLHPGWFAGGIVLALFAAAGRPSRRTLGVIALAVLVVAVPFVHRAVAFDTFGLSSFSGMNLERATVLTLPQHRLDELIRAGRLSPAAAITPFQPYDRYAPFFPRCDPGSNPKVLRETVKSDGTPNFNSVCFLPIYRQSMRDAVHALREDPGNYLHTVGNSTLLFSSWGTHTAARPPRVLKSWMDVTQPFALPVHVGYSWGGGDPQAPFALFKPLIGVDNFSVTVAVSLLLSLVLGLRGLWRWFGHRASGSDQLRVYIAFTVVSVAVVSVLFDTIENARFREPLDPLLLGPLVALLIDGAMSGLRRLRRGGGVVASGSSRGASASEGFADPAVSSR